MKWRHIIDEQPEHDQEIIQIDAPHEGHYTMGMRKYYQKCSFEEIVHFDKLHNLGSLNFWWMPADEFPFPDKKDLK